MPDNTPKCPYCDDQGWVCESHPDNPWGGVSSRFDACECGPGVPCGHCNVPDHGEAPRMPPDTVETWRLN